MIRRIVVSNQFLQGEAHARFDFGAVGSAFADDRLLDQFDQLVQRDRRFGGVDDRFEFRFQAHGLLAVPISSRPALRPAPP